MTLPHVLLSALLLACILCPSYGQEEEMPAQNITVVPDHAIEQTGEQLQFQCSSLNGFKLYWTNPNGTRFTDLNSTRFQDDGNGTMLIKDGRVEDSGIYRCHTLGGAYIIEVEVDIYHMPSYFMEGMIILGINAVLLVIFLICLIHSTIQHRRMAAKQGYKDINRPTQNM
jgi:hypothetical protein